MFPKLIHLAMSCHFSSACSTMQQRCILSLMTGKDDSTVDTSSTAGAQSKQSGLALSRETPTVSVLSPDFSSPSPVTDGDYRCFSCHFHMQQRAIHSPYTSGMMPIWETQETDIRQSFNQLGSFFPQCVLFPKETFGPLSKIRSWRFPPIDLDRHFQGQDQENKGMLWKTRMAILQHHWQGSVWWLRE